MPSPRRRSSWPASRTAWCRWPPPSALADLRPDWALEILDDLGHIPHLEDPKRFVAVVRRVASAQRVGSGVVPGELRDQPRQHPTPATHSAPPSTIENGTLVSDATRRPPGRRARARPPPRRARCPRRPASRPARRSAGWWNGTSRSTCPRRRPPPAAPASAPTASSDRPNATSATPHTQIATCTARPCRRTCFARPENRLTRNAPAYGAAYSSPTTPRPAAQPLGHGGEQRRRHPEDHRVQVERERRLQHRPPLQEPQPLLHGLHR